MSELDRRSAMRLALILESAASTVVRLDVEGEDYAYAAGRLAGIAEALGDILGIPAFDLAVRAKERAGRSQQRRIIDWSGEAALRSLVEEHGPIRRLA